MSNSDNIIRDYDRVRVISPYKFVRCGYPLCVDDIKEELLAPENSDKLWLLVNTIRSLGGRVFTEKLNTVNLGTLFKSRDVVSERVLDAIAYDILKARRYGGPQRTIHTEVRHDLLGKCFTVIGIKRVRTGVYCQGTSYIPYEDDGEGPSLCDGKNHKIVHIGWDHRLNAEPIWFEANRLEKLSNG